jgi:hypothetical protein
VCYVVYVLYLVLAAQQSAMLATMMPFLLISRGCVCDLVDARGSALFTTSGLGAVDVLVSVAWVEARNQRLILYSYVNPLYYDACKYPMLDFT